MDSPLQDAALDIIVPEEEDAAKGKDSEEEQRMSVCLSDRSVLHGRKKRISKSRVSYSPSSTRGSKKTRGAGKRNRKSCQAAELGQVPVFEGDEQAGTSQNMPARGKAGSPAMAWLQDSSKLPSSTAPVGLIGLTGAICLLVRLV
ncbi:Hypothetical predicted protein [Pelobates cultripes]|uniref:Uncharacterized protein n=1 Tax=Pelobates cultripes TaxID=61616 RepID=A0AAD1SE35_PELCU|nr:Hypothetical predicted protein [Pelobates cultripes]